MDVSTIPCSIGVKIVIIFAWIIFAIRICIYKWLAFIMSPTILFLIKVAQSFFLIPWIERQ